MSSLRDMARYDPDLVPPLPESHGGTQYRAWPEPVPEQVQIFRPSARCWGREAHIQELSTCSPGPPLNLRIGRRRPSILRLIARTTRKGLPRWR